MHRRSRDNPEGDSIQRREKQRLQGVQNMLANTPTYGTPKHSGKSRKRPSQDQMENYENAYMVRKARQTMIEPECSSLGTPETISQISVIAPPVHNVMQVSDAGSSLLPKGKKKKSPRGRGDDTWEMAVDRARGQPDGGESDHFSPSPAKRSRQVPVEAHYEEIPETEYRRLVATKMQSPEFSVVSAPEFERKKSVRVKVQSAAKKLKKKAIANKRGLNHSKVSKRKFEETLPDETVVNVKRAKVKDMTWKERRQARKIKKNNYELIQKAKHVWETCRRRELTVEQRHQICSDLFASMRDKIPELAFAHDTARIIQCLVQNGDTALRAEIMELLKDHLVELCKSKYGKFIVKKLLKYGSKQQRNAVYRIFHGHVKKLLRHKEASVIVEYAYNQYANASQRLNMLAEFYGVDYQLLKTHSANTFQEIMATDKSNKKDRIISGMKDSLLPLADKEIIVHSMVHRLFFEFFCFANEKQRSEMIEALREGVVHMLHTYDGARVTLFCLWHGTAKDRKVIIKSFKTHVVKICKEEFGHTVLMSLFDVVDDTKIVQKVILDEMMKSIAEVAEDQYGRKVLLYLLSPRDPQHFHPNIIHLLSEGDSNAISKKDASVRQRELLEHISPCLLSLVKTSACSLVTNSASTVLVAAVIQHAIGDPTECMEAIAELAAEPFIAGELNRFHLVEDTAGHLMLKKLIAGDKERLRTGRGALFSKILLDALPDNALKSWAACNRGCFVLISLLELDDAEVEATVLEQLSGLKKSLRKMTMEGPKILLQKLEALSPSKQPKMIDL